MIDADIIAKILATTSITSKVSQRVFQQFAEQGAQTPFITQDRIGTSGRDIHHSGSAKGERSTFRFTCVGRTALEGKEIAETVRSLFHNYRGTLGSSKIAYAKELGMFDFGDIELGFATALDIEFFNF